tara:strand:- start:824 stop:1015 length:192 start_codon:yes stop_codon:yes gene_type:complete
MNVQRKHCQNHFFDDFYQIRASPLDLKKKCLIGVTLPLGSGISPKFKKKNCVFCKEEGKGGQK